MPHVETRETPPPAARFHASRGIVLTQALRLVVRVATAASLARLISPTDYGVFGMAALLHGLAYVVQDFGLSTFTLRQPTLNDDARTALFWLNVAIGVLVALVVAAAGVPAAAFFGEPSLRWLLPALAGTFLCNAFHAQLRAQLAREHRFDALNRIEITAFALSSAVAVFAAWRGAGVWALALLPLTAEFTILVGVWLAQRWRPSRWPAGFPVRDALQFGAGVSGHEILRYFQRNADQFFVGRWFGPGPLGFYGRAAQLVTLPIQYLIDPLATWVIATLSQLHADPEAQRTFWRRVLNGLAHLSLPLAVILLCVPHELLRVAFGPNWTEAGDILSGLALLLVAQPMLAAETWVLIAAGRSHRLVLWAAAVLVAVVAACLLTRSTNPAVIATASSGTLLVMSALGPMVIFRGLPVRANDVAAAMVRPIVLALVAGAATLTLLTFAPNVGVVGRLGFAGALTALVWLLGCLEPGVRQELTRHFLRERR